MDEITLILALFLTRGQDFRPAFSQLTVLGSLFPDVPLIALTATAPKRTQNIITSVLNMKTPLVIIGNVDRPNIFFAKYQRGPSRLGFASFESILRPIAEKLKVEQTEYPVTIIYLPLKWCVAQHTIYFVRYWVITNIFQNILQGSLKTDCLHNTMHHKLQG